MPDEKKVLPQIPSTVWWGLRDQFKKTIPAKVTDTYLVAQLGVQSSAAKTYLAELRRVGLVEQDGRPTDAARKWRMDESYREAADALLATAYPPELIDVAPPDSADRAKAVRWMMNAYGLGEGAAKNKAATYFLIGSNHPPADAPTSGKGDRRSEKSGAPASAAKRVRHQSGDGKPAMSTVSPPAAPLSNAGVDGEMPLNVNIQIHISADATSDQIESIFANMRKYMRG